MCHLNLNSLAIEYINFKERKNIRIAHYQSSGGVVLFPQYGDRPEHSYFGNFHPDALKVILSDASYKKRLSKAHSHKRNFPQPYNLTACELDSCSSSDALLMNIFCHPSTREKANDGFQIGNKIILGKDIHFGVNNRLLKINDQFESRPTEIDMVIGGTVFEAKLTEDNFQKLNKALFDSYPIFAELVNVQEIQDKNGSFLPIYQLLRNAAVCRKLNCAMVVIIDERRNDLKALYNSFFSSIRNQADLSWINMISWQELSRIIGNQSLSEFLRIKYGIF